MSTVPFYSSIRARLLLGFASMGVVIGCLGGFGVHALGLAGRIVQDTYDRPLMAINFARAANLDFVEMRDLSSRIDTSADRSQWLRRFAKLQQDFADDLGVAEGRFLTDKEREVAQAIRERVAVWASARTAAIRTASLTPTSAESGEEIVAAFDRLIEYAAESSFCERQRAMDAIGWSRSLALTALAAALGIALSIVVFLGRDIVRPLAAAAAVADRIAAGELKTSIPRGGRDETGRLLRSMAVMQESIRCMMAAEQEQKQLAEDACAAKSRFLANMSHELRTPLNAIIGFSDIIAGQVFGPVQNEKYREYAGDILASGRHLLGVINTVLDLAKSEANKWTLDSEPVSLGGIVAECTKMIRGQCTAAGLALETRNAVPDCIVVGDPTKLRQIFLNLLSNAMKFSAPGGTVSIAVEPETADAVAVSIVDTGIGMRPEDIPIALSPFGQIDSRLARRYQGTGLGLPLTKALIEAHRGRFELESTYGVGTTVRFILPNAVRATATTSRLEAAALA